MSARSEREAADLEAISYMGHSRALCATMIARGYPPAVVDACLAAYQLNDHSRIDAELAIERVLCPELADPPPCDWWQALGRQVVRDVIRWRHRETMNAAYAAAGQSRPFLSLIKGGRR